MLQSTVSCNTETEIEIEKRITTSCPPVTSEFTQFWQSYPKKIGKSAALKVWEKIKNRPPIETILTAIENQKNSNQWKKENGQFIPNPTTWLNQGRWDDEIFVKKSKWD
ncbi:hypothetical protein FJZ41_03760 [Candidatus Shapirobacteria bacterium]|nr:hypothetical protein [Candidatus Shapirobacteria bacterium]